jgi:hypothetical protein
MMRAAVRLCVLILLLAMAGSGHAAVEDDWSVLSEAEIREALGVGDRDAGMGSWRRPEVWWTLAWGSGGALALGWLAWMALRGAMHRWRGRRPQRRLRWWGWLFLTPVLLFFLVPAPWTLPFLWQETRIELNTWRMYFSGRPLLLQGTVLHSETGEPLEGVVVRYSLSPLARFQKGSPGGCHRFELVLRTNAEGRWRVELPAKAFAPLMAEYAHLQRSPMVRLYAHGLVEDIWAEYTEQEREWIRSGYPWGQEVIRKHLREMMHDRREYMRPRTDPMFSFGFPGVRGFCADITRTAGPEADLWAEIRRELREIWCSGPADGSPWPEDTRLSLPWAVSEETRSFNRLLDERTAGLDRGTHDYDRALCEALKESEQ